MANRRTFIKQAGLGAISIGIISNIPGCAPAPQPSLPIPFTTLPRSVPEKQGISSTAIRNLLAAIPASGQEFHGLMIVRRGHVVAEGWWAPFAPELKHTLYSLSKSYTSTAVGLCVADGKFTIEDNVLSFFQEDAPAKVNDNLASMKVKHLLTMNTGHDADTMGPIRAAQDDNWVKAFLAQEVVHQPGSHFLYNTGATYMLSAIVQKVTGQSTFDFLSKRLFEPLNITGADWEADPKGISVGGYGLRVKTEDIAKLGQLYLQKGAWNGEQLLPAEWVEAATSKQTESQQGDNDWSQGYGYQFWRCKPAPGFYRGDGAFGQYCIVIPQKQTVIAINSESADMQKSMQLVWDHILPALQDVPELPADETNHKLLMEELAKLSLPVPAMKATSPVAALISGKTFALDKNDQGATSILFSFEDGFCNISLTDAKGTHKVIGGIGNWNTKGQELQTPTSLFAITNRMQVPSQVAASAGWQDDKTLLVHLKYIENVHGDQWTCRFEGDQVNLSFRNSVAVIRKEADGRGEIKGKLQG